MPITKWKMELWNRTKQRHRRLKEISKTLQSTEPQILELKKNLFQVLQGFSKTYNLHQIWKDSCNYYTIQLSLYYEAVKIQFFHLQNNFHRDQTPIGEIGEYAKSD